MAQTDGEARAFLVGLAGLGLFHLAPGQRRVSALRHDFRRGWRDQLQRRLDGAALRHLSWYTLGYRARTVWPGAAPDRMFDLLWRVCRFGGASDTFGETTLPRHESGWSERTSEVVDEALEDAGEPSPTTDTLRDMELAEATRRPRVVIMAIDADRGAAERLYAELLGVGLAPWYAARDLLPGERWDEVVPAQISSADVMLVLVTNRWPRAGEPGVDYYASEKIALAIEVAQRAPAGLRVIAVLLDGARGERIPFGLRRTHAIHASSHEPAPVVRGVMRVVSALPERTAARGALDDPELAEARRHRDAVWRSGAPPEVVAAAEARMAGLKRDRRRRRGPTPGLCLAGRWSLVQRAGRGGFAEVWQAWDAMTTRYVAVKILHPQYEESADRRERFFRGARQMARVVHPAVVRIVEPAAEAGGFHFFVMEWLSGGDLQAAVLHGRIERRAALGGLCRVADALAMAHAMGIVHRDVKPANILLDARGEARLADFDLVRAGDTTGGTRTGALGTFVYAAPEAMEDASRVGPAVDVYGLGMSALFVLLGRPLPRQVLRDPAPVVADLAIPGALRAEVLRAVDWEPTRRHPSAVAFASAIRDALDDETHPTIDETHPMSDETTLSEPVTPAGARIDAEAWRPALVQVPPGGFKMGSPDDEAGRRDGEGPVRWVTLPHGLWVTETPITAFHLTGEVSPAAECPAVSITWFEARDFCNALSRAEGLAPAYVDGERVEADGYRLPTEAEWEYICRAGTTTRFCTGDDAEGLARVAWYRNNSGRQLHAVGRHQPNAWGLYDLHGNCREWCEDWYGAYPGRAEVDPLGPVGGRKRVVRGGSWSSGARGVRSAFRDAVAPDKRSPTLGFRVVRPVL